MERKLILEISENIDLRKEIYHMTNRPKAIIVMKVGPHSNMSLSDIIISKKKEEKIHGFHYWGYSGVFCQPSPTQQFCQWAELTYKEHPKIVLIETKSAYKSNIGFIHQYSTNGSEYQSFKAPVQLQGAQFSFVAKNLYEIKDFKLSDYIVVGGKNDGLPLNEHLRFRVNKSFAKLRTETDDQFECTRESRALVATLVSPFAIWLKE